MEEAAVPLISTKKYPAPCSADLFSAKTFFRKCEMTVSEEKEEKLNRVLSVWELIGYGVASTIGAGIFVTVGIVAKNEAGPGIIVSFLFAGFASFLSALCYSEFASRIPVAGSAYTFSYVALGEIVGWFVGWNLTLEYAISASAVARGWAGYFVAALNSFGVNVPLWLYNYPLVAFFSFSPLSAGIIILCTIVLLFGIKESARFNLVITVLNLVILGFIIGLGSFHVDTANLKNFLPFGFKGTLKGVGTVFFSYIGFDSVSTLSGEVRNPGRDLPIGIVGTLAITSIVYIAVSIVITGMVPYYLLNENAPLSAAFESIGLHWASLIIAVGSLTTMSATTLCSLIGQPRIFFQMAQDGLMFGIFGKVNKNQIPVFGTIITGIASALIACFFNLDDLTQMISIGTLLAFSVVCAGVVILRFQSPTSHPAKVPVMLIFYTLACILIASLFNYGPWWSPLPALVPLIGTFIPLQIQKHANLPTTFTCPLVPFVPCLGILFNVWFIVTLPPDSFIRLAIWTFIGLLIYFFYGIRYSTAGKVSPMGSVNGDTEEK